MDAFVMSEIAKADADNDCRLNHAEFVTCVATTCGGRGGGRC